MLGRRQSSKLFLTALMIALAAAAFGAGTQQRAGGGKRSVAEDGSQEASFTFKIAPKLPEFKFKVIFEPLGEDEPEDFYTSLRDVEVFSYDSGKPFQHLTGCDFSEMQSVPKSPPADYEWFRADDFNFDGYKDIYLMTNWGATGNQNGCVWLYNTATKKFDYSKEFSALSRYWLDPASKTILTFVTGGAAGRIHIVEKYKVEDNRPVLIWSENQDLDSQKREFHCVVQELRGKKMVTVRDERGGPDIEDAPCDASSLFPRPGR
jgi:hypothetical protein